MVSWWTGCTYGGEEVCCVAGEVCIGGTDDANTDSTHVSLG